MHNLTFGIGRTCWKVYEERGCQLDVSQGLLTLQTLLARSPLLPALIALIISACYRIKTTQRVDGSEVQIPFSKVGFAFGILNLNQMLKVIPVKISNLIYTQCLIFMWCSLVFWIQIKNAGINAECPRASAELAFKMVWVEFNEPLPGTALFFLYSWIIRSKFTHLDTSLSSHK